MNERTSKKNLMLFTDGFPFGNGESFLIPEIPHLSEEFSVTIVTSDTTSPLLKNLAPEILVRRLEYSLSMSIAKKLKYGFSFFTNNICRQEFSSILKTKYLRIRRIKQSVLAYAQGNMWYNSLEQLEEFSKQDFLYFYWYNPKLIGTALALRERETRPIIFCRLHGYDLYNEREAWTNRQPFKPLIDSYVDHLYFVSKAGYAYYKANFGFIAPHQYSVSYLGIVNTFGVAISPPGDSLSLVSCSNVIPLKRIELIIRALALIEDLVVSWTHFGGGSSLQSVIELAELTLEKKENITFTFTGNVQNNQIHEYYQNHGVDCFILVSETEGGCPVSIQEAMSYGIPVIGTSVGGIPEMIDNNGFLLEKNPSDAQVAEAIKGIFNAKNNGTIQDLRKESRQIWEENFNADINYFLFIKGINQLNRIK